MMQIPWRGTVSVLLASVAVFVLGAALAASRNTQSTEGLDRLIPREKWAGAGLDKLTAAEQQTLAEDISSLLAGARTTGTLTTGKDRSQWRKLQRHMAKDDVKKLLGEPETVSVSRFNTSWYYTAGSVTFDGKGRVEMWMED